MASCRLSPAPALWTTSFPRHHLLFPSLCLHPQLWADAVTLKDDPLLLTGPSLTPVVPLHALHLSSERAYILTLATPEGLVRDV